MDAHVPTSEQHLLARLLQPGQSTFWPAMLAARGVAEGVNRNGTLNRVRRAVDGLVRAVFTRSITRERAAELLPASKRGGHAVITRYAHAIGQTGLRPEMCDAVLDGVEALERAHEALSFFEREHCADAADADDFASELQRTRRLDVPLRRAESDDAMRARSHHHHHHHRRRHAQ